MIIQNYPNIKDAIDIPFLMATIQQQGNLLTEASRIISSLTGELRKANKLSLDVINKQKDVYETMEKSLEKQKKILGDIEKIKDNLDEEKDTIQ